MISHPFLTFGRSAVAEQAPSSTVQGRFMRRWGGHRRIITPAQGYRETILEPQQTDRETKE